MNKLLSNCTVDNFINLSENLWKFHPQIRSYEITLGVVIWIHFSEDTYASLNEFIEKFYSYPVPEFVQLWVRVNGKYHKKEFRNCLPDEEDISFFIFEHITLNT